MDPVSQGMLGAAVAQTCMRKGEQKAATLLGMGAGLLADADIFIRSSSDTLLTIEYHRHFTHALLFIPFGALIAAVIGWFLFRHKLPFRQVYIYCLLGYLLSGVLDACTSYGTHLLLPFDDERVAWHLIAIVDPVFTLALITGVVIAYWRASRRPAIIALLFCGCYLLLGAIQLNRAEQHMMQLASSRGHEVERHMVKPTIGNLLLWRSVYQSEGWFHVDAIRAGFDIHVYEGESARKVDIDRDFRNLDRNSVLFGDILRFQHFSDDYIVLEHDDPPVLGDVRYAITPTSTSPLWGIVMDSDYPDEHAIYRFFRQYSAEDRQRFLDMLLGR